MKNNLKIFACFAAGLLASGMAAHAQVGVTATLPGTGTTTAVAPTLVTSGTFDMNGGNAIALLVTSENSSTTTNISATFAGQPMTLGMWTNQTLQWAGIFYLINPATTVGAFEITGDQNSGGLAYSAIALGNAGSIADSDAVANTVNVGQFDLVNTTQTNGGFVLGVAVNNGFSSSRPGPAFVSGPADQFLLASTLFGSSGHLHNYGDLPTAGTYTNTYANINGSGARNAYVTLAFETAELLTPLSWAVGNGTWDINTTANWSNDVGLVVYKELGGVGNDVIFNDTASGASPITVTLNTAVSPLSVTVSNASKNYAISGTGSIDGGGTLTKAGGGMLTLGTANTFSGDVNLNGGTTVFSALNNLGAGSIITFDGGTLQYASGNVDDISARTITFAAGGATIDVGVNAVTFNNPVGNGGSGGLTKLGAGTLNLTGANNYSGDTVISQGTLGLFGTLPGSSNIVLSSGTTLDAAGYSLDAAVSQTLSGVGGISGSFTMPSGTTISPATSTTLGTLMFTNFGTLDISGTLVLNATTGGSDLIVADYLNINPGTVLTVPSPALTNGSYKLIQVNLGLSGSVVNIAFNLGQAGKAGDLVVVDEGGGTNSIHLVVSDLASDDLTWSGTGSTWDQAVTADWYLTGTTTPWAFTNGSTVRLDEIGAANPNVFLDGVLKPSLVVVSNPVTDYSLFEFTVGSRISGSGSLLKQGAGKLTIFTANDNTGATTIEGGALDVVGTMSSGPVTNNGELILSQSTAQTVASISGTGGLTRNGGDTVTVAGVANYTGPTTINAGTLLFGTGGPDGVLSTSAITNNGTLVLNSSTDWNYAIPDTGTGNLRKMGINTLTMNGPNSRTGETRADGGKIILGNANQLKGSARLEGGTLDMNGNDQLLLNLTGGSGLVVNDAGTATNILTVSNVVNGLCSAAVSNNTGSGGVIALVKDGTAELDWRGANAYSGGTEIRQGRIRAVSSSLFGTGPVNLTGGGINFASSSATFGNTINLLPPVGATTNTWFPTANVFAGAPVVGTEDLLIDFSVGGNNDTFSINGGAAKWAGVTNTVYLRGTGGWLRINSGSIAPGVTFDLSDSGVNINASGTRTWELGGLVGIGSTGAIGDSEACTINLGAKNLSSTFDGRLTGNFNWIKVGTGTQTFTGTNSAAGFLTVSNGTLKLANDAAPSSMNSITVATGATLDVSALADFFVETNELGEVTNSFYVTNATLSLGTGAVAQTLAGGGTVNGSVVIGTNGTVAPGTSIGALTIANALTIDGIATMELDRTNSQTADLITAGSFSGTGTVSVTNIGPDLVTGDTFQLFSSAVSGVTVNLPVSNALNTVEYVWTNKVAIDGSIELLSGVSPINPNPTNITFSASGGILNLSWPSSHLGWILQSQTNSRTVGLSTNWADIAGSASVTATNFPLNAADPTVFYRLRLP